MKLLGWMHRKFRQNNSVDVAKDFPGGGTCSCLSGHPSLEDDHNQGRSRELELFPARNLRLPPDDHYVVGAGDGDQATDELWSGLLTIGTMGSGADPIKEEDEAAVVSDVTNEEEKPPETVKDETAIAIPALVEAIAEKEAEATTETDLMVVTAELEKVLAAEAKKTAASAAAAAAAGDRISSARPSHVVNGAGPAFCPLQGFLFGSPIELAETAGRRVRRASLGELFMRSRIAEEGGGEGKKEEALAKLARESADFAVGEGKPAAAGKHTMMKRMLKRRGSNRSDGGGAHTEASSVETKFHKIIQIFHRKIHPENSSIIKSRLKSVKNQNKGAHVPGVAVDGHNSTRTAALATDSNCAQRKEIIANFSFRSPSPSFASNGRDSSGNREHWIKTDADFLVLEL